MSNGFVKWIIKFKRDIIQFFQFQFVSVIAYWADYGVFSLNYALLFAYMGDDPLRYTYSKMISYIVGLMTSYLINKRWTFGVKRKIFSMYLLMFIVVNVLALTANLLGMYILTEYYNIDSNVSQILSTVFSFSINYSGNKLWVFEKK
jgi:putative flippase GtrA